MQVETHCPICGSGAVKPFCTAVDRHNLIAGTFQETRCSECSVVFVDPTPDNDLLARYYPNDYYSFQDFTQPETALKIFMRKLLLIRLGTVDPGFMTPGRMLDIGCGSGAFLYGMRKKGWTVHGVEISEQGAQTGRTIANLDIFNGTLLDAKFPAQHFDYVRSNHSFEHLNNPHETLAEVKRILKPDGRLHIGVPNIESWNARRFMTNWWYLGAPVHTFNYSPKSLTTVLERNGFAIERVVFNSDFSGILGSLQIKANRGTSRKATEGRIFNSYVLRVLGQRWAKLSDLFGRGDAIEIIATPK